MKNTYYFSHDYEPFSDPKILALYKQYEWAGYGLYWRLIEMLHSDESHKLPKKPYLYTSLSTKSTDLEQVAAIIDSCISDFELFQSDGEFFWSERVLRNIEWKEINKMKKSKAGQASAEARRVKHQMTTDVEQNPTKDIKINERIEEERKTTNNRLSSLIPQGEGSNLGIGLGFVEDSFKEPFMKWLQYKKDKKQPYRSQVAIEACYKHMQELSLNQSKTAMDIVNRSIANNYNGLIAPITPKYKPGSEYDT